MIRYHNPKQRTIAAFDWPFPTVLDEHNRWVILSRCIPWEALAAGYNQQFSRRQGRPAKEARLVIGAVIIKHKLNLSDRETVAQIQENPYLQYFVGLSGYQTQAPFAPSLLVEIRKRMGQDVFEVFHTAIVDALKREKERAKPTNQSRKESKTQANETPDPDTPTVPSESSPPGQDPLASGAAPKVSEPTPADHQGKVILDATVAPQAIRYPTDLSLLNEARQFSERIIDRLYVQSGKSGGEKKPRTYRVKARKAYLAIVKQRRPGAKALRRGIKQQLQYLRRNLGHIEDLLEHWKPGQPIPLPRWLLFRYWVIQHVAEQQWEMYRNNVRRCDHRIVSISQPYVRPILRGKPNKSVEFGAKLSISLTGEGLSRVDHLCWEAFHEGGDLPSQVQAYHRRYGVYPKSVLGDPAYGTRENRRYLKALKIHFAGKPLGRPKQVTEENKEELKRLRAQRREDYLQRIPVEGKIGQGKNGYRLNYIRAKRADTSLAWINSIFLVMNLLILLRIFFAYRMRRMIRAVQQWIGSIKPKACTIGQKKSPNSFGYHVETTC